MTEYSLYPAFLDMAYHSAYGSHHAIIPTREWSNVPLVPLALLGSYMNWNEIVCDGEAMVDAYVDAFLEFFPSTTLVDTVTVFTMADEDAPKIPRAIKAYGQAGTDATSAWSKAVQKTWTLRDVNFNVAKYVMLDCLAVGGFDKVTDISGSAESLAYVGTMTSSSWAFSSRAGFKPLSLQSVATDINDKLRKEYGMG